MTETLADLYLRLSDGRDLTSLQARERKLRREADRRGWTVRRVVTENDVTPTKNGKSRNASAFKRRKIGVDKHGNPIMRVWRPGFRSILDALATRQTHAVLAEDLDRAVRDPRDLEDLLDIIEAVKGTAASLSGSLQLTRGGTDAEIGMARGKVNHANMESRDKARRVRDARERQAEEAIWAGGRRPYGFTPVAHPEGKYQNTRLEIDESEAAVIREVAVQLLSGVSLRSVVADLNCRGVRTVTGAKWTGGTVRDVVTKPLVAGIVVRTDPESGITAEASRLPHAILPEEQWKALRDKLSEPAVSWVDGDGKLRTAPRYTNRGRPAKWLGTGIYLCPCGSTLDVGPREAYRCRSLRVAGGGGGHVRRSASELDKFVAGVVIARLSFDDGAEVLPRPARADVDLAGLHRQAAALREIKARYAACLGRGECPDDMDPAEFAIARKANREALVAVEAQLTVTVEISPLTPFAGGEDPRVVWKRLSLGQRRSVVQTLLVITVLPVERRGRGFDPTAIRIDPAQA